MNQSNITIPIQIEILYPFFLNKVLKAFPISNTGAKSIQFFINLIRISKKSKHF